MNSRAVITIFITLSCAICCNKKKGQEEKELKIKIQRNVEQSEAATEIINFSLSELLSSLFTQSRPSILNSINDWNNIAEMVKGSINEYRKLLFFLDRTATGTSGGLLKDAWEFLQVFYGMKLLI